MPAYGCFFRMDGGRGYFFALVRKSIWKLQAVSV